MPFAATAGRTSGREAADPEAWPSEDAANKRVGALKEAREEAGIIAETGSAGTAWIRVREIAL